MKDTREPKYFEIKLNLGEETEIKTEIRVIIASHGDFVYLILEYKIISNINAGLYMYLAVDLLKRVVNFYCMEGAYIAWASVHNMIADIDQLIEKLRLTWQRHLEPNLAESHSQDAPAARKRWGDVLELLEANKASLRLVISNPGAIREKAAEIKRCSFGQ